MTIQINKEVVDNKLGEELPTMPKFDQLYVRINPDIKAYIKTQARLRNMSVADFCYKLARLDECFDLLPKLEDK